jgi:hypothetical protein
MCIHTAYTIHSQIYDWLSSILPHEQGGYRHAGLFTTCTPHGGAPRFAHFYGFGDAAFAAHEYMRKILPSVDRTHVHLPVNRYNRSMSRSRIVVEWQFGLIKRHWGLLHNADNLRIGSSKVAGNFFNAAFLSACLGLARHRVPAADYFGIESQTLEYYLANLSCQGIWEAGALRPAAPEYSINVTTMELQADVHNRDY